MSEFEPKLQRKPPEDLPHRPIRREALLLWALAGFGLVLINLLSLPLSRAMAGVDVSLQSLIFNLAYYLIFVALPLIWLGRRRVGNWLGYRPYQIGFCNLISIVALALLGVFFFIDLGAIWSVLLEAIGVPTGAADIGLPSTTGGLALSILCVAVLPAICEEFLFRGAILSGFEMEGTRRAVIVSALMFALMHGSIEGLPMQFLVGVILGWLVVYCDSIYAGIVYHTTHNAATILLQFAVNRQAAAQPQAEYASMIEALGGFPGVARLLAEMLVTGALMLLVLRMFRVNALLHAIRMEPPHPLEKLRASEWVLLLLGVAFAGLLYGANLYLGMIGGGA